MDGLALQLLAAAVSGLSAAVGGLVLRRITDVGREVATIAAKVQDHGESLSAGARRFDDMERRIGELEREQKAILKDGCARIQRCAVGEG